MIEGMDLTTTVLLFVAIGFAAQAVDGALGMGSCMGLCMYTSASASYPSPYRLPSGPVTLAHFPDRPGSSLGFRV